LRSIEYHPAGPVAERFHKSDAFVRGLMGPVGSSKSSACWMELLDRAMRQKPNAQGVRRTRAAILRNTYPELKSTTIKTCLEWSPMMQMRWDSPITGNLDIWLPDKTRLQMEVHFLALERPEEVDKLGSLELTFGWINEVREVAKAIFDKLTERVGRFPPVREGGPTWRGVVLDTNPPDDDSWYYKLAEKADPELVNQTIQVEAKLRSMGFLKEGEPLIEFFKQPGGLIEVNGQYEPNPAAENIPNLDGGHAYYFRQIAGKRKQWIKAQILGQYATVANGKPVYPEYNDDIHCKEVHPNPLLPLILGWDFGLNGMAVVIGQLNKLGQLVVLDELTPTRMEGLDEFAETVVKPHLAQHYPKYEIRSVGDPSGAYGSTNEAKTAFQILANCGFVLMPALSNDPMARIESVRKFLTGMVSGQPRFLIDPKASKTRKGLAGRYLFERVQVSNKEIYKDKPVKDEYSHSADALGYLALHVTHVDLNSWSKGKIVYPQLGVV
jgi:hypothetical protein